MARLLVVEDDVTIGRVLRSSLAAHGHDVLWVDSGAAAIAASDDRFELVLLDLGLPDMDGVELCRSLRISQPTAALVVLTARDEEIDVVLGLEAGADDYLTKPFRLAELLARIHAHLRRSRQFAATTSVSVGELLLDNETRRSFVGRVEMVLTPKEFDLLARLVGAPGVAVSRATLMADVWDPQWFGSTKTLDVHISSVRRKLAASAADAQVPAPTISTVRSYGYRLEVEPHQVG